MISNLILSTLFGVGLSMGVVADPIRGASFLPPFVPSFTGVFAGVFQADPASSPETSPQESALGAQTPLGMAFQGAPTAERRQIARSLAEKAPADSFQGLSSLLDDPDSEVRQAWIVWATRPDHGEVLLAERVGAAIQAALQEADPLTAKPWLVALAQWENPTVHAWLPGQWLRGEPWRAQLLAEHLRPNPQNHALLRGALNNWATLGSEHAPPPEVLAELLPHLGRALGDAALPNLVPDDFFPLVVGMHHPDRRVLLGAATGLQALLQRLTEREDPERLLWTLSALKNSGLDAHLLLFEEARLGFYPLADGKRALAAARALLQMEPSTEVDGNEQDSLEVRARRWRFRAHYLTGIGHLSLLSAKEARIQFVQALEANSQAMAQFAWVETNPAAGQVPSVFREQLVELLQERVLLLIGWNMAERLDGVDEQDEACLQRFLEAHRLHLEVQVLYAGLSGQALGGWDGLFDNALSPYRLLLHGRSFHDGLSAERALELEGWIARGLATVSPLEMPGFEPFPSRDEVLTNPIADLVRRTHLEQIQWALLEHLKERIEVLQRRVGESQSSPLFQVPEEALESLAQLDRRRRVLLQKIERTEMGIRAQALLEVRVSGGQALRLARGLRAAGHLVKGRELVKRFQKDLNAGGIGSTWFYLGQERLVRADLELGSNLSDADKPVEAEKVMLVAVERLQGIIDRLKEVQAEGEMLAPYNELMATTLVSLAVNANVRLANPERALGFYERAYELKQDDFMRVLLACYRARSGKRQEALELLGSVTPAPPLYYNLACTHALLGNSEEALNWLRAELTENHSEASALRRQKDWARKDPDLVSLGDLPAFKRLLE